LPKKKQKNTINAMVSRIKLSLITKIILSVAAFGLLTTAMRFVVTSKTSLDVDFWIYWQAGRALILNGTSPYADSTTEIIQMGIFGRPALASEDQLRYAYPPFSLLVIFPTVVMSYPWAQASWLTFNLCLITFSVFFLVKKVPLWLLAGLVFFYPISRGVILGQFALMLGASLIFIYGMITRGEDKKIIWLYAAGFLMAWCCMKPHLTGLIVLFYLLWAFRDRYREILWGFLAGGACLLLLSFIMEPRWISEWLCVIRDYAGYIHYRPILRSWLSAIGIEWSFLLTKVIFALITVTVAILLFVNWWRKRIPAYFVLGWLILVVELVNPNQNSLLSDQILFLLPLLIWLMDQSISGWIRGVTWGIFICVPWVLFLVFIDKSEPFQIASGLAAIFGLWLITNFIVRLIGQFRSKTSIQAIPIE